MKKFTLTLCIIVTGFLMANAQTKGDKVTAKMMNHISQVCQLTPDQASKVQPMVADFVNARMANKQQYASDVAGYKAANKTARLNFQSQLKTVLSPEQMQALKAAKEQKGKKEDVEGE